jgi:hypothetical protein
VVATGWHPKKFCSRRCKEKEGIRLRNERRQAAKLAVQVPARVCALPGCSALLPARARKTARYCCGVCRHEAKMQSVRRNREKYGAIYNANEREKRRIHGQPPRSARKTVPPPAPVVIKEPVEVLEAPKPKLPPTARPCFGCKHMRLNQNAERGVLCAADLFTPCNPLAPTGPKLKEAI